MIAGRMVTKSNIVLIGMPGVGKSTVGVLLAKRLSRGFVDTDVLIQSREGKRLQELLNEKGRAAFVEMESGHVCTLKCRDHVVATGGSVVYGDAGMQHLKGLGIIVHLDLACELLQERLRRTDERGVVKDPNQSICQLYAERQPLYRRYAEITIDCAGLKHEEVVQRIVEEMERRKQNLKG